MEYFMWSLFLSIWITPTVGFWCHMEFFKIHHNFNFYWHMEYSIWLFLCHLEYSMWSLFHAIWSLPYHSILMPYGVLHKALKTSHMDRFIFLCYEAFHIALYLCTRQQFTLIFSFFKAQSDGFQLSWKWNFLDIPKVCFIHTMSISKPPKNVFLIEM